MNVQPNTTNTKTTTTAQDAPTGVTPSATTVHFTLNGSPRSITVNPTRRLLDVLRDDLGLTGTKEGCGEGECGACAVVIDGRIKNSCIVPVGAVDGAAVETIEAVRETRRGQRLVDAFAAHGAVQCGFCIPGMIVAADSLLRTTPHPTDHQIREGIAGNLCRCTGYDRIVEAVAAAAADDGDMGGDEQGAEGETSTTSPPGVASRNASPRKDPAPCSWYRPADLAEALAIRARGPVTPIAGATDLYVRHRRGGGLPPMIERPLLALAHLPELNTIEVSDTEIRIGAAVPYTDVMREEAVPHILRAAIADLAAPALRNAGTLGGNICNASPAADAVCPLYALDAQCEIRSHTQTRRVPIGEVITGPGRTTLTDTELLTAIFIPRTSGKRIEFYRKVGTRRANALSKLSIAAQAEVAPLEGARAEGTRSDGTRAKVHRLGGPAGRSGRTGHGGTLQIRRVAIALGAVAPTVVRVPAIEARMLVSGDTLRHHRGEILKAYAQYITPIDDQRSTASYRREVALNLIARFIDDHLLPALDR